jgi:rare lipoprotein A
MMTARGFRWNLLGLAAICIAALLAQIVNARSETVRASWYGSESHGRTASGAPWRPMGFSAAHRSLRFGTRLRVTFRGRSAIVVVLDRGPARYTGRDLDLSRGAARAIGLEAAGVGLVHVDRLD